METAPLKSFATWARTTLIREVTARVAVVLGPGSPDRIEQPGAIAALEKAVKTVGGGDKGREAVAEQVAYTWFNRIIALRFMDANGYTGIGVVSPQAGMASGQPEILADAKRGAIDETVVGTKTRDLVTGLLNGTRRSQDPQGEAYALLLAEYCRHWNHAMPFMFEREGDYTELLIPANLLADDSLLTRAVAVLTPEVCEDVEVIGWLYQFYISERKDEVFAGFKKNKKAGAAEIPAATQLFTPHWIVRYLVENSLGRLWMLNRPSSLLVDRMEYYVALVDEDTDFLKIGDPDELKVIDPACGSGHMLTYAFDLLYAIYEEEGYAPSDIPSLILTNNLYGVEIDPRAGALAAFVLAMKARAKQRTFFSKQVEPNVCVLESHRFTQAELKALLPCDVEPDDAVQFWNQFEHADSLGSLIQPQQELLPRLRDHLGSVTNGDGALFLAQEIERAQRVIKQAEFLSPRYTIAIANPPYMGSGNMGQALAEFTQDWYPASKSDLFAVFIERCLGLVKSYGLIAMITMQSWMFLASLQRLREAVLSDNALLAMAHLGTGAFDAIGGEVVATTAFVVRKSAPARLRAVFVRLVDDRAEAGKRRALAEVANESDRSRRFDVDPVELAALPGSPVAYWSHERMRRAFLDFRSVGDFMFSDGLTKTGSNGTYLRLHWEVSASRAGNLDIYRVCAKGGGSRGYFGNLDTLVNWTPQARAHYRRDRVARISPEYLWERQGITWTKISSRDASFRLLGSGQIAETGGPAVFLKDGVEDEHLYAVLGLLSSRTGLDFLELINPTLNVQTGDILRVPYDPPRMRGIAAAAKELVAIAEADWSSVEPDIGFQRPTLVAASVATSRLDKGMSAAIDELRLTEERYLKLVEEIDVSVASVVEPGVGATTSSRGTTLFANPAYRVSPSAGESELRAELTRELASYAVGCMFGRYSLDTPGLILADQGATLQEYLAKAPNPSFMPDADNVIPIVDGDWFEDDIVAQFRKFLRVAFGEEHFEENLRFVTESLGVKDLRDYFVKSFYADHVKRYKKRPIYWLFSSPKGSFNALIYLHRYTPSTVSTVLNEYLREYAAKVAASQQHHERLAAGGGSPRGQVKAQKEADRLRKVLLELEEYEHDVLYPLASQQLSIDLDDGVKANYPKFGAALKKIPGLEASDE
jgi:hypothetical protein